MTRESKLALIIGFVLVLVVGVLVSDHFSQANSMDLDIQEPQSMGITQAPMTNLGQQRSASPQSSTDRGQGLVDHGNSPVMIQNSRTAMASRTDGNNSLMDRAFEEAKRRIQETELPQAAKLVHEKPTQNRQQVQRPLPTPRITQYASYTVKPGDTLIGIARRQLGNAERWREIHELNADRIGPNAILKVDMKIKLPIQAQAQSRSTKPYQTASSGKVYVVEPGDTLGEISTKLLGTSKRVDEFVSLNHLEDANDIRDGMKLKVPG